MQALRRGVAGPSYRSVLLSEETAGRTHLTRGLDIVLALGLAGVIPTGLVNADIVHRRRVGSGKIRGLAFCPKRQKARPDPAFGVSTCPAQARSCGLPSPNSLRRPPSNSGLLVGTIANMKASLLLRERIPFREDSFAELVLWRIPSPLPGSAHSFRYRLAFVRSGVCLVRFDDEAGKGDHRHVRGKESKYSFVSPEKLVQDFMRAARRADDEDRDT